MATRFVQQATEQLNPLFNQQQSAVQAQIPAIQQLYQSLNQGLEDQAASSRQGILEDTAARGVLNSTIPGDLQTALSKTLLQQRAQLGFQQGQDVAGVNKSLADIGLQRTQSISSLADLLQTGSLKERDFRLQQLQAQRAFELDKQRIALQRSQANSSSAIDALIKKIGKTSGLGGGITFEDIVEFLTEYKGLAGAQGVKFGKNPALDLKQAKASGGLRF